MIFAIDVHYRETFAVAAGILFEEWNSEEIFREVAVKIEEVAEYVPGEFYKRELPCITELLKEVNEQLDYLVIDGHVYLGSEEKPGLGKYLWDSLENKIPIIGVAKSAFKDSPKETELRRGNSDRPLYITAIGVDSGEALEYIKMMHGEHRIPTLLKKVDQLGRQ